MTTSLIPIDDEWTLGVFRTKGLPDFKLIIHQRCNRAIEDSTTFQCPKCSLEAPDYVKAYYFLQKIKL